MNFLKFCQKNVDIKIFLLYILNVLVGKPARSCKDFIDQHLII